MVGGTHAGTQHTQTSMVMVCDDYCGSHSSMWSCAEGGHAAIGRWFAWRTRWQVAASKALHLPILCRLLQLAQACLDDTLRRHLRLIVECSILARSGHRAARSHRTDPARTLRTLRCTRASPVEESRWMEPRRHAPSVVPLALPPSCGDDAWRENASSLRGSFAFSCMFLAGLSCMFFYTYSNRSE